jgi:flavin-dependent dehydrogenase
MVMTQAYDIVIMGGAFSGASLGLLMKRARPETKILIVERSVEYDRKVGESTSEVAACFLTKILRMSHYLDRNHLSKHGLRLWFNDGKNECLSQCSEIGAFFQTRLPTYQLDRSLLDQHILDVAEKEGCEVWRPAKISEVNLNGAGKNTLQVKVGEETREVTAGWVVDATGKAATLARKLGHWRKLDSHPTNSLWARFKNVGDLDGHKICSKHPQFASAVRAARTPATNHLMGRGWWCWIIPLRNGDVSLGLTYDRRLFEPPVGGTIPERLIKHACTHPIGKALFEHAEGVEHDARAYAHLPYYTEQAAGDGWSCVGDAAGFMDPLYSQGLDYCGHTVYATHKLLLDVLNGADPKAGVDNYNMLFKQSYMRWYQSLYQDKYHYLGDAELMNAAFLLDLASYFAGPVRLVYDKPDEEFSTLPYSGKGGMVFAKFMSFYNRRLSIIARKRWAAGTYGAKNLQHRFLLKQGFSPDAKLLKVFRMGIGIWLKAEWNALFLPLPAAEMEMHPKKEAVMPAPEEALAA